jgi:hypothetical protein
MIAGRGISFQSAMLIPRGTVAETSSKKPSSFAELLSEPL